MTETSSLTVSDEALDVLFRKARSYNAFLPGEISDAKLHALYDLVKWGPTTANSQPQRILFLRSQAAKDRLAPALSKTNLAKTIAVAGGGAARLRLPVLRSAGPHVSRAGRAEMVRQPAGAHLYDGASQCIVAGGLSHFGGPRAGARCRADVRSFDNAKVDAEFFPDGHWKSNFLCILGKADPTAVPPRNPRFAFDEVCKIL